MTQVIGLLDLKSSTRGIVPALVTHTIECLLYVCVCVCVCFPTAQGVGEGAIQVEDGRAAKPDACPESLLRTTRHRHRHRLHGRG